MPSVDKHQTEGKCVCVCVCHQIRCFSPQDWLCLHCGRHLSCGETVTCSFPLEEFSSAREFPPMATDSHSKHFDARCSAHNSTARIEPGLSGSSWPRKSGRLRYWGYLPRKGGSVGECGRGGAAKAEGGAVDRGRAGAQGA